MMRSSLRFLVTVTVSALLASTLVVTAQTAVGNYLSLVMGTTKVPTYIGDGSLTPAASTTTGYVPLVRSVTLTNAQIKDLPITPITIVPAAGAGLLIDPIRINLFAKVSSGAYTNINAAGTLSAKYADGTTAFSYVPNDGAITAGSATRLTDLLGTANYRRMFLQRYFDSEGVDGWGPVDAYLAGTAGSNSALQLYIDNAGSMSLTGGNAANTLTAVVTYSVIAVP